MKRQSAPASSEEKKSAATYRRKKVKAKSSAVKLRNSRLAAVKSVSVIKPVKKSTEKKPELKSNSLNSAYFKRSAPLPKQDFNMSLPDSYELFTQAWAILKKLWQEVILIGIIPLIPVGIMLLLALAYIAISLTPISEAALGMVAIVFAILGVVNLLVLAFVSIVCKYAPLFMIKERNEEVFAGQIFQEAVPYFWRYLGLAILVGLVCAAGLVLFFIPGIIWGIWFAFSLIVLIAEGKGGIEAMKRSKELVKGYWWSVFSRLVAFGVVAFIASLLLSIVFNIPLSVLSDLAKQPQSGQYLGTIAVLSAIVFLVSLIMVVLEFVITIVGLTYVYLIYEKLKTIKELSSDSREKVSPGQKILLSIVMALPLALIFIGFILALIFSVPID